MKMMILNISVSGATSSIEVEEDVINEGLPFFAKMDEDMDKGWTMGREFIDNPGAEERCQIVADKLLTAIDNEDERLKTMMAGYILSRVPHIITLHIDNTGDMMETWLDVAKVDL